MGLGLVLSDSDRDKLAERLRRLSFTMPGDECIYWIGSTNNCGYGQINISTWMTCKRVTAHRLAYELWVDEIPDGKCVLHTCNHPDCINPKHLRVGSRLENQQYMAALDRGRRSHRGLPYGANRNRDGKFQAQVKFNGKIHYLGRYATADEASAVALAFKRRMLAEASNDNHLDAEATA